MTHRPLVHLSEARSEIAWLERHAPLVLDHLARITPSGGPTSTLGGGSGGGDVSRPTELAAIAGLEARDRHDRIAGLAAEALGALRLLVAEVRAVPVEVDTVAETSRIRCTGGAGEWADPSCSRNAVTRSGLCSPCYQRMRYHTVERAS